MQGEGTMKKVISIVFLWFCLFLFQTLSGSDRVIIELPEPRFTGSVSVEESLNQRMSVRAFDDMPLTPDEVSQLLWACAGKTWDGVTRASRTYASAGGLHPLELYILIGSVQDVPQGIYKYDWKDHTLQMIKSGDFRGELSDAAIGQIAVLEAPVCIVITAVYKRTSKIYGERGAVRYVHMDAGHAGQNIYLQASSLGLGTVAIGAFFDTRVSNLLELDREQPLLLFPVGRPLER
jgi:SagB-type dehydrogenase family enzyme